MEQTLYLALIQAYTLHRQKSRLQFAKLGLTDGQPKILRYLLENNGTMQKDLSEECNVTQATMTSLLRNMQSQGLVEKKEIRLTGGKRGYLIFLTPAGHNAAILVADILENMEALSLKGFSDSEKDKFLSYLARYIKNLSES